MNIKSIQKIFATISLVTFVVTWYFTFGVNPLGWNDRLAPAALASNITWVGGSTGTWESALNWSGGSVPTSADDVTISSTTSNIVVTLSTGQTANFNSLTIGGVVSTTAAITLVGNIGTGGSINVSTSGTLTQQNAVTQTITGVLTAENGSTLTHTINSGSSSVQEYEFDFVTGGLVMQTSSVLTVSGKGFNTSNCASTGFSNGVGPGGGIGSGDDGSGASHGGLGGGADPNDGPAARDFVYGSSTAPITYGSGGGNSHFSCGGVGAGMVNIGVTGGGSVVLNGTINADGGSASGANGFYGGGGSGGSVWFNFTSGGTFSGSGTITARGGHGGGGNAFGDGGGGGGGGRIAITGQSSDSFAGSFLYHGGRGGSASSPAYDGGAGTLFKKLSTATYGDLSINNATSTDYTATNSSSTMALDNLFLTGFARFVVTTGTVFTISSSTLPSTNSVSSTLDIRGTFAAPSTFTIKDRNQVHTATTSISSISNLTVDTDAQLVIRNLTTSSQWNITTLTVNGQITTPTNTTAINHALVIDATTITVGSAGSIIADGTGYSGGVGEDSNSNTRRANGPGGGIRVTSSNYGGGAGYGGLGGDGQDASSTGGISYGTTSTPDYDAGSGGGPSYFSNVKGGAGGGIIRLSGTTVTISGTVSANGIAGDNVCGGTPTSAAGGGSGGGIKISATTLSGNGIIQAKGGRGGTQDAACSGGGGGGGRILLSATVYNFTGTATTTFGTASTGFLSNAGDGTAGTTALAPLSPTGLYAATSTAQSGSTNPTGLATTTPVFSAIFLDHETNDTGTKAQIQVSTSSSFATITHWDSGVLGTSITSCAYNTRCQDIRYGNFGSSPTLNLSLNDDGAESATQTLYYWRIRFFDALGANGSYSTTTATFTLADAPSAPTAVVTSSIATSSLTMAWTDNSSIETGFEFQTSTNNSTYGGAESVAANSTTGTIGGLLANTQYYVRVRAVNSIGNSAYATSSPVYTAASTPVNVSAIAGTTSAATVTWGANGNNTSTAYYVVDTNNAANNSGWVTSTSYTFTNLSAGTAYTFSVKARNGDGVETAAATGSVTTQSGSDSGSGSGSGGTGGGGDGQPDAAPTSTCNAAIDPNCGIQPSGLIKITKTIGGPNLTLTNQRAVMVELVTTYADLVALKQSDGAPSTDFSGASFETIKASVAWNLQGSDGQKCVNARFANSAKRFNYNTYACTVLDTTPPTTPTFYVTGISSVGVVTGLVKISSLVATEPNQRLTFVLQRDNVVQGTYYADTDAVGNWSLTIPVNLFTVGSYQLASTVGDLAGNTSSVARLSLRVAAACTGPNCSSEEEDAPQPCRPGTSGPNCTPTEPKPCPAGTSGPNCTPDVIDEPCVGAACPPNEPVDDPAVPKPCPAGTSGPNCTPDVIDEPCVGANCTPTDPNDPNNPDDPNNPNDPNNPDDPNNPNDPNDPNDPNGTGGPEDIGTDIDTVGGGAGGVGEGRGPNGVGGAGVNSGEEIVIPTSLTAPARVVALVRGPVAKAVEQTIDRAVEFVSDPQVQTVNQVAVAPTLAVATVANALAGAGTVSMLNFLHFVFAQPILALRRRNHKAWGVVYNAYSKLPVDLAAVRLIEVATGRVLQSQVTDLQGRYFLAIPDLTKKYRLEVSKAGYKGIAQLNQTDDAPFLNLYHGIEFAAAPEHPEISYSIPLEPDTGNPSTIQIIRQKTKQTLHRAVSSFGLIFSVVSFVITPSLLIGVFVLVHALVYGLFYIVGYKLKPDTWGIVRDRAQKNRLGRVVVRVFDAAYNKLVSTAVTDTNGRYAVLVGPSRFVVTYEKIGYDKAQSEPLDFTPEKTKGHGGIINRAEFLQKSN